VARSKVGLCRDGAGYARTSRGRGTVAATVWRLPLNGRTLSGQDIMPSAQDIMIDAAASQMDPELVPLLAQRDCVPRCLDYLRKKYSPADARVGEDALRDWERAGCQLLQGSRAHEALAMFWSLYEFMLAAQDSTRRIHKGMPLVWLSEAYSALGFPVHAKRYLMLALCEDAIRDSGVVPSETTGTYFRLVWQYGLSDADFKQYARRLHELFATDPKAALFPEALLQELGDEWLVEIPSPQEAMSYRINGRYLDALLADTGDGTGKALERIAEYLMSCMPGCRTSRRLRSQSTDYDVVCRVEGVDLDFRSEFGRYFVCESKDWSTPADFAAVAKFCRILDSVKARFGILFSQKGHTGIARTTDAERELVKVFQDRGLVIVVVNEEDLRQVSAGRNLIQLLKGKYETVRLDLRRAG
jgi:hypothetical protein